MGPPSSYAAIAAVAAAVTPRPPRRGLVTGDAGSEVLPLASPPLPKRLGGLSRGERGRPLPGACGGGDEARARDATGRDASVDERFMGDGAFDMWKRRPLRPIQVVSTSLVTDAGRFLQHNRPNN